jgi:hypothetical protein
MRWVDRWRATSTLTPLALQGYYGVLAKAGRWLAAEHPEVAGVDSAGTVPPSTGTSSWPQHLHDVGRHWAVADGRSVDQRTAIAALLGRCER